MYDCWGAWGGGSGMGGLIRGFGKLSPLGGRKGPGGMVIAGEICVSSGASYSSSCSSDSLHQTQTTHSYKRQRKNYNRYVYLQGCPTLCF